MTPDQLRDLLRKLAAHLATLHEDLEEAGWHAARTSQTGVRTGTTGSKPPCNVTELDFIVTDDEAKQRVSPTTTVKLWCKYLHTETGISIRDVMGEPANVWVAWLSRHRAALLSMPWADEAIRELSDLEYELRHRLYPTEPHKIARPNMAIEHGELPTLCTTEQLCSAYNVQPATIRKWKERGKIEPAGTQTLTTGETIDLWKISEPS